MDITFKTEKFVTIKNMEDTGKETCTCKTWKNHWETFSKKTLVMCSIVDCFELDSEQLVGAHVNIIDDNYNENDSFIIPMCKKHNGKHGEKLPATSGTTFVCAIPEKTCKKLKPSSESISILSKW